MCKERFHLQWSFAVVLKARNIINFSFNNISAAIGSIRIIVGSIWSWDVILCYHSHCGHKLSIFQNIWHRICVAVIFWWQKNGLVAISYANTYKLSFLLFSFDLLFMATLNYVFTCIIIIVTKYNCNWIYNWLRWTIWYWK